MNTLNHKRYVPAILTAWLLMAIYLYFGCSHINVDIWRPVTDSVFEIIVHEAIENGQCIPIEIQRTVIPKFENLFSGY